MGLGLRWIQAMEMSKKENVATHPLERQMFPQMTLVSPVLGTEGVLTSAKRKQMIMQEKAMRSH